MLRAWSPDDAALEPFLVSGQLPPQGESYFVFQCSPRSTPSAAALEAAPQDADGGTLALHRLDNNWADCGLPLCDGSDEELLKLAR